MKKLLRLSLFALLALCGGGNLYAQSVTLKYSGSETGNMTGNNDAATVGLDATEWSVVAAKGGNSNFPGLNKAGDIRLYYAATGSNTITVTSLTGATINSIKITFTGSSYSNVSVKVDDNTVTAGTDGSYAINSSSFVLGNANTSNAQVRITEVVINYTASSDSRTATSISFSDGYATKAIKGMDNTVALPDATVNAGGSAVSGAAVSWSSSDETVATISGSEINVLKEGTTTIKASYAGDTNYKESSNTYILNVYKGYTTIASMLDDVTANKVNVAYVFNSSEVLVTLVKNSYVYINDGTDNFLLYGSNLGLNQGDKVKGIAYGQLYSYNGLPELAVSKDDIPVTKESEGNSVTPTTITVDKLSDNVNAYIKIEGAVYVSADSKNLTFKVGETEFIAFNTWGVATSDLTAGNTYTIIGAGAIYSKDGTTTYQLYPYSFEDTTGINHLTIDADVNAPMYNLKGERVDGAYRGVVIQNGKKKIQK